MIIMIMMMMIIIIIMIMIIALFIIGLKTSNNLQQFKYINQYKWYKSIFCKDALKTKRK